jgi:hypothetical protein
MKGKPMKTEPDCTDAKSLGTAVRDQAIVPGPVMVHFRCAADCDEPRLSIPMSHVPDVGDIVSFISTAGQPTASRVTMRHWSISDGKYHVIVEML